MSQSTLRKEIEEAIPKLLQLARELTSNQISENCKFILTEIKDNAENAHVRSRLLKKENDKKVPVSFQDIMPGLEMLYENLYDINLYVYRAARNLTIIDIRYYPKSSLDELYRQKVFRDPPMLHCSVIYPPWLLDKKKKFDINWQHKEWLTRLKLIWMDLNMKIR